MGSARVRPQERLVVFVDDLLARLVALHRKSPLSAEVIAAARKVRAAVADLEPPGFLTEATAGLIERQGERIRELEAELRQAEADRLEGDAARVNASREAKTLRGIFTRGGYGRSSGPAKN